jgi:DNA-binding NarL/FixJ family response regulator
VPDRPGARVWGRPYGVGMPEPSSPQGGSVPRVLIADDDPDVRAVLSAQLARSGFDVVATAADTDEAIALAGEHHADIAIVDVQMPGGGGVRATQEIRATAPGTAIVALSADESERIVLEMLTAGP